jgi:hypothetical protein
MIAQELITVNGTNIFLNIKFEVSRSVNVLVMFVVTKFHCNGMLSETILTMGQKNIFSSIKFRLRSVQYVLVVFVLTKNSIAMK